MGPVVDQPTCRGQPRPNISIYGRGRDQPVAMVFNSTRLGGYCILQQAPDTTCLMFALGQAIIVVASLRRVSWTGY